MARAGEMSRTVRLELPLPPSMNTYWRRGPNRSPKAKYPIVTHISAEGRVFRRHVKMILLAQRGRQPLKGHLYVFAALWTPTLASDVDNRIKPALDALQHAGVYANDNKIADVQFIRGGTVGRKNKGRMLIEVGPREWKSETVAEFKAATKWEER